MKKIKFQLFFRDICLCVVGVFTLIAWRFFIPKKTVILIASKKIEGNNYYFDANYTDRDLHLGLRLEDMLNKNEIALLFSVGNKSENDLIINRKNFQMSPKSNKNEVYKPIPIDERANRTSLPLRNCELQKSVNTFGIVSFDKPKPVQEMITSLALGEKTFQIYCENPIKLPKILLWLNRNTQI